MSPSPKPVEAYIAPCPLCQKPMVVLGEQVVGGVTVWKRGRDTFVTTHVEGCEYIGKALPK